MSLSAGARLGPYQIVAKLGQGGMGQVYKARDTRLDRDVAVKVLSPEIADDPEFRARFEREARHISALDHPNICALYDVGQEGSTHFLVMQYLDGDTLAARIEKGPLPLEQALKIGIAICDALADAHRHGITHRDLKPANVILTRTSAARQSPVEAKLLDFGLAKTAPVLASSAAPTELASPDHAGEPLTRHGTILGTFDYMSPEQVEGDHADARSDIWAFGCVLYEMLTGRRPFGGKTRASVMGAILKEQPPSIASLQPRTPSNLDHVVSTCLAKDPDDRWQSVADIGRELKWIAEAPANVLASTRSAGAGRRLLMWIGSVVIAIVTTAIAVWQLKPPSVNVETPASANVATPIVRATLKLAIDGNLLPNQYPTFALSPDGRLLAYRDNSGIRVRALAENHEWTIDATRGGSLPFFSPDGGSLGFFANSSLKRVALGGGKPVIVVNVLTDELRGAAWGDDGFIYYAPSPSAGLWRISAEGGGSAEQLTTPDFAKGEKTHRFPFVLPGSQAVLFMVGSSRIASFDDASIEALSLKTLKRVKLSDGGMYPQYAATGHLLYSRVGKLIAVPFDVQQLRLTGSPVTVADGMCIDTHFGFGNYAVSRDGLFVRISGGVVIPPQGLSLVNADGRATPVPIAPTPLGDNGRVVPNGMLFAMFRTGATTQVQVLDLVRGNSRQLTFEWDNENVIWSPDGSRMIFSSNRSGGPKNLYSMRASDGSEVQRLFPSTKDQRAYSWADDNVAYVETSPDTGTDIYVLSLRDRTSKLVVGTPRGDTAPAFSKDGQWIAYLSAQSGPNEVYVQRYPSGEDRQQISNGGQGGRPIWHPNGRQLIFKNGLSVMSAALTFTPALHADAPVELFQMPGTLYDILPDGRFLLRPVSPQPPVTELEVVVNWFQELRNKTGERREP